MIITEIFFIFYQESALFILRGEAKATISMQDRKLLRKTKMAPKIVLCCISVARWAPVVFITAIVVWSYYAYFFQMCLCKHVLFNETV